MGLIFKLLTSKEWAKKPLCPAGVIFRDPVSQTCAKQQRCVAWVLFSDFNSNGVLHGSYFQIFSKPKCKANRFVALFFIYLMHIMQLVPSIGVGIGSIKALASARFGSATMC